MIPACPSDLDKSFQLPQPRPDGRGYCMTALRTSESQIISLAPDLDSDRLLRIQPSPVVQLNRAVAIAMRDGPEAGLTHIDALLSHGELANYYPGAFSPCRYVPQARQDI